MENSPALRALAANLVRLRDERGWSQEDLAHESDVKPFTAISKFERGIRNPTVTTVERLARALGVSIGELLGDPHQPQTAQGLAVEKATPPAEPPTAEPPRARRGAAPRHPEPPR